MADRANLIYSKRVAEALKGKSLEDLNLVADSGCDPGHVQMQKICYDVRAQEGMGDIVYYADALGAYYFFVADDIETVLRRISEDIPAPRTPEDCRTDGKY